MHTTTTDATHAPEPSPFLAHHFDSQTQQFDAGKLGIWLFLVTEILFFSGLFVAYAVYRSNHPEVFLYAHQFLDKTLGAVNTVVLLFSSLTMAWGVRGEMGDLILAPQLVREEFSDAGVASVVCQFAGKKLTVTYVNPGKLDAGKYRIDTVTQNGADLAVEARGPAEVRIARAAFASVGDSVEIKVFLTA